MEEINKRLKASKLTLDQSQAKRIPLSNASRSPTRSGSKTYMFDNLGATPYTSPTKPGTRGKERAASSSQGGINRKKGMVQKSATSSKTRPDDESDDDLLLTGSSAYGSPSKAVRLSDTDDDSDIELKKDSKSGLPKRSTLPMKGKEICRAKTSSKSLTVKSSNSQDFAKRPTTQKMNSSGEVARKVKKPVSKAQRPVTTLVPEVGSTQPKEAPKTTFPLPVNPLDQLLKEKNVCQAKEEHTPKPKPPKSRIKPMSASKVDSDSSNEVTRATCASRSNPLVALLKEKEDSQSKEGSTLRFETCKNHLAKGKGKVTALQPFPMDFAASTSTKRKDTSESDEEDPLRMNDVDVIITRGGPRPFPMSSQDFEGFKTSSKPTSDASSSNTKRGSSPNPDDWAAKRRRKTNGMLEDYEFADLSLTQFEQRDPKTLCPFCDQSMPESPSPLLQDMLDRLKRTSYPDPRPTNSLGRRAPLLSYITLCQRHQFETKLLPKARAKGWPSKIDFKALPSRVARLKDQIHGLVRNKERSIVWKTLKKEIERKGIRRVMGISGQFEGFKRCQPGYYGEQGAVIIYQALFSLFPNEVLESSATAPLSYTEFVQCVLVPEVAASLVQEDMGLETREEALEVLEDSSSYGVAMFPDNENEEEGSQGRQMDVGEKTLCKHVKTRRKEVDDGDLLDGLELTKPVKAKKAKRKPTQSNDVDDLGLFSSDSTTSRSEVSYRKTKRSEKSSMASSPDDKENMHQASSSSQTLVSRTAAGKARPKYGIRIRPDVKEDLDATPRPKPRTKNQMTTSSADNNRSKNMKGHAEPSAGPKLTGVSNPLQMARLRKTPGASSSQSWRYDMTNESSDDDAGGPPSSSLPQRSQITSLAATTSRKGSQWLLSDGPTPDTTPHA